MLESRIENTLTKWCEKQGIVARKYTTPGRRGAPDHIFFRRGKVALIEFKQKGCKLSELQEIEIDILTDAEIPVTWVDNVEAGKEFLMRVFKFKREKK